MKRVPVDLCYLVDLVDFFEFILEAWLIKISYTLLKPSY